jgi:hypothetical protein
MEKSINNSSNQTEHNIGDELRPAAYARVAARLPKYISKAMQAARPLAYASEVGESFRKIFPWLVKPLYALSIGYVFGDIGIKYYEVSHKNFEFRKWFLADLSLWHLSASLVLPAVVINRYIHTLAWMLAKTNVSHRVLKIVPTLTALCLIPFIVHPLDHFTDYALDATFRKYVDYKQFDDVKGEDHVKKH